MKLDFAFLAQYADFVTDGKLAIFGAGIDGVQTSAIPFQSYSMSLVVKFLVDPEDEDRPHLYRIEITTPAGERKLVTENQVNVQRDETGVAQRGSNLIVNLNIHYSAAGLYYLHIVLDDADVKSLPISVSLVPELNPHGAAPVEAANE